MKNLPSGLALSEIRRRCSDFTLLFCRRRLRNIQSFISNARAEPLFCSLKLLFYHILVVVAVVVCLKSLMLIATCSFCSRLHDTVVIGGKGPFTIIQNTGANEYVFNMADILAERTAGNLA